MDLASGTKQGPTKPCVEPCVELSTSDPTEGTSLCLIRAYSPSGPSSGRAS